ncbi:MAG: T9SS type A sorting domain-containing protein, partial [Lentimicrobium sp.]|nr:T9SS type A sorting domain-containing protein [Lentimicrobium sp.]
MRVFIGVIIMLLATLSLESKAQFTIDAGDNKVHCNNADNYTPVRLGGNPTATGGTEPYTYKWEAYYFFELGNFSWTYFASYFLSDTTAANPTVEWMTPDCTPIQFKLTVTDANNQTIIDSTIVSFSVWNFTLDYWEFNIMQGDSIYLNYGPGAYSNYEPCEYLWRPNHGITDSTHASFWASPDHSITYNVTITDAAGCRIDRLSRYHIYVTPVSTEDISLNKSIEAFPVPAEQKLNFRINRQMSEEILLIIYDFTGRELLKEVFNNDSFSIDVNNFNAGLYVCKLFQGENLLGTEKVVIK